MLTTNDDTLAELLNQLRNHGASISEEQRHLGSRPYILPEFDLVGYNYRMTDLQGALGSIQIDKLKGFIEERNKWANFYHKALSKIDWITTPIVPELSEHGWQSYVLMIDEKKSPYKRNEIMEILQQNGISTRPGTHSVHMLRFYKNHFNIGELDYPNAYNANQYSMSIPLHNLMGEDDYEYIVNTINSII
jgi:perosamine synthetase